MNSFSSSNDRTAPRLILLACGAFSPPTPLHLRMFEIAKDYFDMMGTFKTVGGIISPVHDSYEKKELAFSKHRCSMVKLSLQSSNWIRMSDWEVNQQRWTRTRQVIQYHQNYINNYINARDDEINEIIPSWLPENLRRSREKIHLKLLCGADLLESFSVPGLWLDEDIEEIVGHHGIVVISRKGSNPEQFVFESDILTKYQKNIVIITNWVANEISSSMIRRLLRRGQSVKYLLDDGVIEYIKSQGLYNVHVAKYSDISANSPENQNVFNENYIIENISKHSPEESETMDETDMQGRRTTLIAELSRPNVFCCKGSGTFKPFMNRAGHAVQVINTVDIRQPDRQTENVTKKMRIQDE